MMLAAGGVTNEGLSRKHDPEFTMHQFYHWPEALCRHPLAIFKGGSRYAFP